MKNLIAFIALTVMCAFCACTSDMQEMKTTPEKQTCRLQMNATRPLYSGETRAGGNWSEGDCVFLLFKTSNGTVPGKAVYDSKEATWTLEYNGILPSAASTCTAAFFEGEYSEGSNSIALSSASCAYSDQNGTYSKSVEGVIVNVNLAPLMGRIRFTGTAGQKFSISGTTVPTGYNMSNGQFATAETIVPATVGSNGSTPYYYMTLAGSERTLSVSYDRLTFSMYCDRPILDAGQSGFMDLPTKTKHSGWAMTETTVPTVGATTVSNVEANTADFSASVVSDGNAAVTECGFVYSQTQNPTLDNMTLKCSASSFTATASDLKKNVTYYVRAYATNAAGTAYGAETSFTTKASLAVTNGLYAYFPFDGDIENHTETEIATLGAENSFIDSYDGSKALQIEAKSTAFFQINDPIVDKVNMTISFWVKDLSDGHVFHAINNENNKVFDLSVVDGMLKYVIRYRTVNNSSYYTNALAFTNGSLAGWHMITISHNIQDGQYGAPATKKLYIDGKLTDTVTEQDISTHTSSSSWYEFNKCLKFVFGGSGSQTTPTKIVIDNFRAYNKRCLSAEEIKEIYNSEK